MNSKLVSYSVCTKHSQVQICEIDLSDMLPPDAFYPSLDELKRREKQRKQAARKVNKFKENVIHLFISKDYLLL